MHIFHFITIKTTCIYFILSQRKKKAYISFYHKKKGYILQIRINKPTFMHNNMKKQKKNYHDYIFIFRFSKKKKKIPNSQHMFITYHQHVYQ